MPPMMDRMTGLYLLWFRRLMLAPSSLPPQLLGGGEHQAARWDAVPQSYGELTADPGINKGSVAAQTRTIKKKMEMLSRQSSIMRKSRPEVKFKRETY